jgi:hypothetical protein
MRIHGVLTAVRECADIGISGSWMGKLIKAMTILSKICWGVHRDFARDVVLFQTSTTQEEPKRRL